MNQGSLSKAALLMSIYDKMSDEEKKAFLLSHLNNSNIEDIRRVLERQNQQLDSIYKEVKQNDWVSNFGANIAGNAAYGAALWLLGRLTNLIK